MNHRVSGKVDMTFVSRTIIMISSSEGECLSYNYAKVMGSQLKSLQSASEEMPSILSRVLLRSNLMMLYFCKSFFPLIGTDTECVC